jgi:hypothetical protein
LSKLATPIAHGFIRQDHAAFGHELFDIAIAETEAEIQPDTVADDLCREPMTLIEAGGVWCLHAASMPHEAGARKVARLV